MVTEIGRGLWINLDCTPEQKLKYVVSLLRKSALDWWDMIPGSKNRPMTLTWDDFLREFANKYTPPIYRDRKKIEFLSLEQGYMTVSEYEMQFSRLSKYAFEEVAIEDAKQRRFEKGLRMDIQEKISLKPPSYSTLLEAALRVEECLIEKDAMTAKKRKMINEYGGSERKGRDISFRDSRSQGSRYYGRVVSQQNMSKCVTVISGRGGRSVYSQSRVESKRGEGGVSVSRGYSSPCARCNRFHSGECWGPRQILCFYCGKPGHIARDCWSKNQDNESQVSRQSSIGENMTQGGISRGRCRGRGQGGSNMVQARQIGQPQQSLPQARVYAVTRQEAPSATDIVTVKIFIYGFDAYTLIDPGSTSSFISYEFALKNHNDIETLGYNICVSMPAGVTVIVDKIVKTCPVIINGNTLYADLVVIKLKEFDFILGMDWLFKNHAIVDCHIKEVVIKA
ncbi:uncharacterized protein LOC125369521 [Ricinus communis]|uniref:uncharacterized protein LOC125369521 n=1 Tax=Ricinus communis TaxID=3988 RepID=UPI00201B00E3|nr:uncharacterized protein LOC125369521 [Ricinus communis]